MRELTIGVIGGGVVGSATARCYLEHVKEVRVYDIDPAKRTAYLQQTLASDLIFVCLPETKVADFFHDLSGDIADKNFVLKSTVAIGTTRRLASRWCLKNIVHSPEFLTERCACTDAQMPSRNIIGLNDWPQQNGGDCFAVLNRLYSERFPGLHTHVMASEESEAVKLITNAFFATKVSFFNEMHQLCGKFCLDWETVRAGVLSDGRIAHSHTQVPGRHGFGFAGACLPKDLETLISQLPTPEICSAVLARNALDRERKV